MTNSLIARLCASLLVLGLFVSQGLAEDVLPVLQTKTESYEKVTVISRTSTHVFVQHSRGVANIKLSQLDVKTLSALGFSTSEQSAIVVANGGDPAVVAANSSTNRFTAFAASLSGMVANFKDGFAPGAKLPNLSQRAIYGVLGGIAVAYLFFCYCSMQICKRTGNEPGVWIWVPLFQFIPLLKSASMSRWWFLTVFVPPLWPITFICWSLKIARGCGKGILTAILLILPVTTILAYMYLGLSGKGGGSKGEFTGIKPDEMEPLPA